MSEFFRKYWFVCLIAVGLVAGLGYYIADLTKDDVSAKKVDGQDVVASTSLGDVTSDQIFDRYQNFNSSLLYNMYQTAVVDQSVDADSDMKTQAKTMARNIKANMDADSTGKTRYSVLSELASYGFEGEDSLEDYCLFALKARALDKTYIQDHYDEVADLLDTSPRTVSIITLEVPNAEILTEEKQSKKDSIDQALENGDSFADTATAFSEDTSTAGNAGFYGYIDANSTDLDADVVAAAIELNQGEYSDWITTQNSTTGMFVLTRVYVDETDPKAILDSTSASVSDAIVSAFISADPTIEGKVVAAAAANLNITFDNEDVQAKIEEAIANATGANTESEEADADASEAADSEEADAASNEDGAEDTTEDTDAADESADADKTDAEDTAAEGTEDVQEGASNEANE